MRQNEDHVRDQRNAKEKLEGEESETRCALSQELHASHDININGYPSIL